MYEVHVASHAGGSDSAKPFDVFLRDHGIFKGRPSIISDLEFLAKGAEGAPSWQNGERHGAYAGAKRNRM